MSEIRDNDPSVSCGIGVENRYRQTIPDKAETNDTIPRLVMVKGSDAKS